MITNHFIYNKSVKKLSFLYLKTQHCKNFLSITEFSLISYESYEYFGILSAVLGFGLCSKTKNPARPMSLLSIPTRPIAHGLGWAMGYPRFVGPRVSSNIDVNPNDARNYIEDSIYPYLLFSYCVKHGRQDFEVLNNEWFFLDNTINRLKEFRYLWICNK